MVFSIARRMPLSSSELEWHRGGGGPDNIFGPHIHLKKVHVRNTSSCQVDDTPAQQMQSQNLDRWAARQAREMVITIERQIHKAKLLPECSSSSAASSFGSTSSSGVVARANESQNVRASSLIQMWRELEAEAGFVRTPRTLSGTSIFNDSEASGDYEPGVVTTTTASNNYCSSSSCSSAVADNEKGTRVARNIIRDQKKQVERVQEGFGLPSGGLVRLRCRREAEDLMERMLNERKTEVVTVGERHPVSQFSHRGRIQSALKVRFLRQQSAVRDQPQPVSRKRKSERSPSGGSSILLLRERFDRGRQQNSSGVQTMETFTTTNVQFPVNSNDSVQSGAIQIDVNNNQYQEVVSARDQESLPPEIKSPRPRSEHASELTSAFSRPEGTAEPSSPDTRVEDMPELNSVHSRNEEMFMLNSLCSITEDTYGLNSSDSIKEDTPELDSPELNSPRSRNEDLQQIADGSWDERSLWVGNLAWQDSIDSTTSQGWLGEVATDEIEPCARQQVTDIGHIWIGSCSPSWRGWGIGEHDYHDFLESFSNNLEIRELLQRRMVSTSLASDFCDKMNRMILTVVNRQDQQGTDENFSEEYEEQPIWRQNVEFNTADHVASGSSLVVPTEFQSVNYPESNWQYTSFEQNASMNPQETETVNGLKTEMAQMHQEIIQLRKLVESCLEWQIKLQQSVKDEVSSAVCQAVTVANASDSSKRTLSRKDSCCICYETQIDSLLYRCGHMCTCFKCAQELQWSSGRCPICRSSIVDVVRAYVNS